LASALASAAVATVSASTRASSASISSAAVRILGLVLGQIVLGLGQERLQEPDLGGDRLRRVPSREFLGLDGELIDGLLLARAERGQRDAEDGGGDRAAAHARKSGHGASMGS
jgi:hypothetical protein